MFDSGFGSLGNATKSSCPMCSWPFPTEGITCSPKKNAGGP